MEDQRDQRLWHIANKRAGFKQNLYTYLFVTIVLWIIWRLTHKPAAEDRWPWPIWVTLLWGIFILLNYFEAYTSGDKHSLPEEEYERLKKEQENG